MAKQLASMISGLFSAKPSGNAELTEQHLLALTKRCLERAQRLMMSPTASAKKFNFEQCMYLVDKLKLAVESADLLIERGYLSFPSQVDSSNCLEVFKLLYALATEVENFTQICSKDAWIQAALTLSNVSEHISSIGFNLMLWSVHSSEMKQLRERRILTSAEVDGIFEAEVEVVEVKASVDRDTMLRELHDVLSKQKPSSSEYQLAVLLLGRLDKSWKVPGGDSAGSAQASLSESISRSLQRMESLGKGCAGTVYRAKWLGAEVAQKTFYGQNFPDFEKEVAILAKLSHPNVASLLYCDKDERECSIVMELMDTDLFGLIQRRLRSNKTQKFPFDLLEAVDIMHQVGKGMRYLHEMKIVHRDLKSMNILVKWRRGTSDLEIAYVLAKVADFGMSKTKAKSVTSSNQTQNVGTSRWMAPETFKVCDSASPAEMSDGAAVVKKYPFKSDVYSFGMVCYEILTGETPFSTTYSLSDVKKMVLDGVRPPLPYECPALLKRLIERCWSADPSKRPRFDEICKELRYLKYLYPKSVLKVLAKLVKMFNTSPAACQPQFATRILNCVMEIQGEIDAFDIEKTGVVDALMGLLEVENEDCQQDAVLALYTLSPHISIQTGELPCQTILNFLRSARPNVREAAVGLVYLMVGKKYVVSAKLFMGTPGALMYTLVMLEKSNLLPEGHQGPEIETSQRGASALLRLATEDGDDSVRLGIVNDGLDILIKYVQKSGNDEFKELLATMLSLICTTGNGPDLEALTEGGGHIFLLTCLRENISKEAAARGLLSLIRGNAKSRADVLKADFVTIAVDSVEQKFASTNIALALSEVFSTSEEMLQIYASKKGVHALLVLLEHCRELEGRGAAAVGLVYLMVGKKYVVSAKMFMGTPGALMYTLVMLEKSNLLPEGHQGPEIETSRRGASALLRLATEDGDDSVRLGIVNDGLDILIKYVQKSGNDEFKELLATMLSLICTTGNGPDLEALTEGGGHIFLLTCLREHISKEAAARGLLSLIRGNAKSRADVLKADFVTIAVDSVEQKFASTNIALALSEIFSTSEEMIQIYASKKGVHALLVLLEHCPELEGKGAAAVGLVYLMVGKKYVVSAKLFMGTPGALMYTLVMLEKSNLLPEGHQGPEIETSQRGASALLRLATEDGDDSVRLGIVNDGLDILIKYVQKSGNDEFKELLATMLSLICTTGNGPDLEALTECSGHIFLLTCLRENISKEAAARGLLSLIRGNAKSRADVLKADFVTIAVDSVEQKFASTNIALALSEIFSTSEEMIQIYASKKGVHALLVLLEHCRELEGKGAAAVGLVYLMVGKKYVVSAKLFMGTPGALMYTLVMLEKSNLLPEGHQGPEIETSRRGASALLKLATEDGDDSVRLGIVNDGLDILIKYVQKSGNDEFKELLATMLSLICTTGNGPDLEALTEGGGHIFLLTCLRENISKEAAARGLLSLIRGNAKSRADVLKADFVTIAVDSVEQKFASTNIALALSEIFSTSEEMDQIYARRKGVHALLVLLEHCPELEGKGAAAAVIAKLYPRLNRSDGELQRSELTVACPFLLKYLEQEDKSQLEMFLRALAAFATGRRGSQMIYEERGEVHLIRYLRNKELHVEVQGLMLKILTEMSCVFTEGGERRDSFYHKIVNRFLTERISELLYILPESEEFKAHTENMKNLLIFIRNFSMAGKAAVTELLDHNAIDVLLKVLKQHERVDPVSVLTELAVKALEKFVDEPRGKQAFIRGNGIQSLVAVLRLDAPRGSDVKCFTTIILSSVAKDPDTRKVACDTIFTCDRDLFLLLNQIMYVGETSRVKWQAAVLMKLLAKYGPTAKVCSAMYSSGSLEALKHLDEVQHCREMAYDVLRYARDKSKECRRVIDSWAK